MIERYTRPEMARIWSEEARFRAWLRVEIAVAAAWASVGRIPNEAVASIERASIDPERVAAIEQETRHDVIAFLRQIGESIGPDARWVHLGLTSSDVIDTALSLQLVESTDLLLADLDAVLETLATSARRYQRTIMMGRTHGVHAEPITFGYKLAVWYGEMKRQRERLARVRENVAVAKVAGAVGTHGEVPPVVEERAAASLGLQPEAAATQVVGRDRHAEYVLTLALIASSLDKMAAELRTLQRTEIGETEEPFRSGQQGSSAMPHKRNPILLERISGLARVLRGYAVPALENVVLWNERDISNSSVERVILPDASILADFILTQFDRVLRGLAVNEERMANNVELTRGLYFSERLLTALVESGLSRPDAYGIVQSLAMRSRESDTPLEQIARHEPEIMARLNPEDLETIFDRESFLRHIDTAFNRLGLD